ncbi:MAG: hypothetical protein ABI604_01710, partial [Nitrospirota bacterium]
MQNGRIAAVNQNHLWPYHYDAATGRRGLVKFNTPFDKLMATLGGDNRPYMETETIFLHLAVRCGHSRGDCGATSLRSFEAPHLTKALLLGVFLPGPLFEAAFHIEFIQSWRNRFAFSSLALPNA